eukprot:2421761-Amphidinium_carterae.1
MPSPGCRDGCITFSGCGRVLAIHVSREVFTNMNISEHCNLEVVPCIISKTCPIVLASFQNSHKWGVSWWEGVWSKLKVCRKENTSSSSPKLPLSLTMERACGL